MKIYKAEFPPIAVDPMDPKCSSTGIAKKQTKQKIKK